MSKEKLNEEKVVLTEKELDKVSGGKSYDTDGKAGAAKAIPEISPDRL